MIYRLYASSDFSALYAIEGVCFQPPFRFGRRYMRQLIESADAATWIAEDHGQMAGFAIVEWARGPDGIVAYIQTIEVMPDRRGIGVGTQLLRRIEGSARATGAQVIWLHVDAENAGAIRLYQANGYRSEGRAEHYYARGRAAHIYAKPLGGSQPDIPAHA